MANPTICMVLGQPKEICMGTLQHNSYIAIALCVRGVIIFHDTVAVSASRVPNDTHCI